MDALAPAACFGAFILCIGVLCTLAHLIGYLFGTGFFKSKRGHINRLIDKINKGDFT